MTVSRNQQVVNTMTSCTGRETAHDRLTTGETSPPKTAKVSPWVCCEDGSMMVVASTDIPAHVTAGPYPGGLDFALRTSDRQSSHCVVKVGWRDGQIFTDTTDDAPFTASRHHLSKLQQGREKRQRWMLALQPARDRHEQNVEVVVEGGQLFLHVLKLVPRGERLLLWYGECLARAVGVPFLTPAHIRGNQQYTCTSCQASFQFPNTLKAHILFKCDAKTPTIRSSSVMSPSAFTSTVPSSLFRPFRIGPSAFHISPDSVRPPSAVRSPSTVRSPTTMRSPTSASTSFSPRARDLYSLASTRRPDTEHTMSLSSKSEGSARQAVSDKRAMTPDSSTDDATVLNLSARKSAHSTGVSSVSIPQTCPSSQHHPGLAAGFPTAGQPIQIFNHIHPPGLPAFPLPLDQHMALRLCYPWLASVPESNASAKIFCASGPLDPRQHLAVHPHDRSFMFPHVFNSRPDPQSLLMTSAAKSSMSDRGGMMIPATSMTVPQGTLPGPLRHGITSPVSRSGTSCSSKPSLMPLPVEKEREPLDLMPPSFFANKSRKGHLCLYCGKLYSRKYGLKIHLRTHTGYKPLKCKVCLRPFGDPSNLNKHVRLHAEGDTPYRCDYCGKVLVRRRDLERHIRSRHPAMSVTKEEDDASTECIDSDVDVTSDADSNAASEEPEIEVT